MISRKLKFLFIGGFLGMSLCLGLQAQEDGRTNKTIQTEMRAAQRALGKKATEVKKANKEALQPLLDQQKQLSEQEKELRKQKSALNAQVNAKLAELDPAYKELSDKLAALQQEQKALMAKNRPARKPRGKKKKKKDEPPQAVE